MRIAEILCSVSYGPGISQPHLVRQMMRTEELYLRALVWNSWQIPAREDKERYRKSKRLVRIFLLCCGAGFCKSESDISSCFLAPVMAEIWSEAAAFVEAPPFSAPMNTPRSKRETV